MRILILLVALGLVAGCGTPAIERERDRQVARSAAAGLAAHPESAARVAVAIQPHLSFPAMFAQAAGGSVSGFVEKHWLELLLGGSAAGLLGKVVRDRRRNATAKGREP